MKSLTILFACLIVSSVALAQEEEAAEQVLNSRPINVDGYIREKAPTDGEPEGVKREIQKQKKEIVLNREKSKNLKVLAKSTEDLSEVTEEYIEEKKAAKASIAEYNLKIRCLQEEYPGKECDKYVKHRK